MIETSVAHAGWTEHTFRGTRVLGELVGRESVTGLLALAVTGRRLPREDLAVLDDLAAVMTVADPRIWPLKVTRLAASFGQPVAGLAAGNASLTGALVGYLTSGMAARYLAELADALGPDAHRGEAVAREITARLERGERLVGFGVPFRDRDERIGALERRLQARGRTEGFFWTLLQRVVAVTEGVKGLAPNIGAGVGAACLDLGLDPADVGVLMLAIGQNTFLANAVEAAHRPSGELTVLTPARTRYVGARARLSARASAAQRRTSGS